MFRAVNQLETVEWLMRTLASGVPFAAITGEAGVGKTVVLALAAARLGEAGQLVIRAAPPFAGPLELQASLAAGLGLDAGARTTPALVAAALRERRPSPATPGPATSRPAMSGVVVLLIDGAEQVPQTVLQYLWLMHRLSGLGGPRLQTVFAGRFAFWERFADPELNDLRSEIVARFVVLPLQPDEASAYVRYRLSTTGAVVPPRLLREIVTAGQGIPARLDAATDGLTRPKPIRRVAVRTVAPVVPAAGRRRGRRVAVLIGAMAAVVAGAVALSTFVKPPLRTAALVPPPAVVAPPQPAPTAPPPVPPPSPTPPSKPPSKPIAQPAPVAPPTAPLPVVAILRIALQYSSADPAAAARAAAVAAQLRERGFLVDDPVAATTGGPRGTVVEYYFAEDREQAEQLARDLGGSAGLGQLGGPREPPPPGTIRIVLANAAVTIARSP